MKLFTVGPVQSHDKTLEVGGYQLPYFRTSEFSEVMKDIQNNLVKLLNAGKNSKVALITASGTGAMEAAISNTLTKDDKVLVVSGGSFGKRFCELCEWHEIPYTEIIVDFEEELTRDKLNKYANEGYTSLLINMHETSIGKLYDMNAISEFCKENDMYLIVDAISTFLSDSINMKELEIDMIILSSQKGLALPPGISFIVASEKIVNQRINNIKSRIKYLDLKDHFKDMERGQTPYTPAVGIILQLHERLQDIVREGIEKTLENSENLANDFRCRCKEIGIQIPSFRKSNALTPILIPNNKAKELFNIMKDRYGIYLTPSGGELEKTLLRVGHLGNLTIDDNEYLVEKLREVLEL